MCDMKKYLTLLNVLLVSLGFVACSDDSDSWGGGKDSTRNKIVGTWMQVVKSVPHTII